VHLAFRWQSSVFCELAGAHENAAAAMQMAAARQIIDISGTPDVLVGLAQQHVVMGAQPGG
jgi:hypothetical protein